MRVNFAHSTVVNIGRLGVTVVLLLVSDEVLDAVDRNRAIMARWRMWRGEDEGKEKGQGRMEHISQEANGDEITHQAWTPASCRPLTVISVAHPLK